ncbi:bifunctional glutamate N-acetyltransferase/amino-acid acetyltransferase ArgJ [Devriesea agamarum]|uniref:bifunctional glutamate N-acetyltransferase/amino-acid acetyltransferase ArgJ n=1 Tax=Devriesea agamarum TaxID=472569 RepID=UPI00071D9E77|nr:bifunctional glutamate N-acetyltransferase/amino-acid acetyltransferase ArgJ [Devriesea agamarum]
MSVTSPPGFLAAGLSCGLKKNAAPDLALVVNEGPSDVAVGVFTRNRIQAAPVLWSREAVADRRARAVVLNSGGANACTGSDGFLDTHRTAERAADLLGLSAQDVLVCSTGLIGERLDVSALMNGLDQAVAALSATEQAGDDAARAIMTTDTVHKSVVAQTADGITIGGMAKGAGMLAPQLATMLVVVTTDAVIDAELADRLLRRAVRTTFNRVDSDACMSTNDTVILMASGSSGVVPQEEDFAAALHTVCSALARALVADAEGASHDVRVRVTSASSEAAAEAVAREVARSNLVKAAIFGNDPNWGRIISAVGCVPEEIAPYDPAAISVAVNGIEVCQGGAAYRDRSLVDMTLRETHIDIDLGAGCASADIWTNDLTHAYVEENSAYSS